jgi:hypothetical protein
LGLPASLDSRNNAAAREVRNLASLSETASTSRVLNLAHISVTSAHDPDYVNNPFFADSLLNKALLVKHTLRANERELFSKPRRTATKIILPFDPTDLRLGGRSVFINQTDFPTFARTYFNTGFDTNRDLQILQYLDAIPSLDPFLVREQLSRYNIRPSAHYLKISPSDIQRMYDFATGEIERLVLVAFGPGMEGAAAKLTSKILANNLDADLEPLKQTFRMSDEEFSEGLFSWRGFLYFKWRQLGLQSEIKQVIDGLKTYRPVGPADEDTRIFVAEARLRLSQKIIAAIVHAHRTLGVYDRAYQALAEEQNPSLFRQFLLEGPTLFFELGEIIGILGHIGSFWSYRMGPRMQHLRLSPHEFADILIDFEDSLVSLTSQPV